MAEIGSVAEVGAAYFPLLGAALGFVGAALGAFVVAVASYWIQRWRYRWDQIYLAVDHLCQEINAAADMATDYWLLDGTQSEHRNKIRELEHLLVGRQMRLSQLLRALKVWEKRRILRRCVDLSEVNNLVPVLFDALTAGDFKVTGRSEDLERAQKVQHIAARLNGALRTAIAHAHT